MEPWRGKRSPAKWGLLLHYSKESMMELERFDEDTLALLLSLHYSKESMMEPCNFSPRHSAFPSGKMREPPPADGV